MKLYLRLLWLVLTQSRRARCDLLGPCFTELRVYPVDLDIFAHVNNGVYLTMMDLGRTDLMLRSDIFHRIKRAGWYPVVEAENIRFRRSLKLWQKFAIKTIIAGWDEKSFYITQHFYRDNELIAEAVVSARFLSRKGGSVTTSELLEHLEYRQTAPDLAAWIVNWKRTVEDMSLASTGQPTSDRQTP